MALPRRLFAALLSFFLLLPTVALSAEGLLRALILSGENNHEWQLTTPALKSNLCSQPELWMSQKQVRSSLAELEPHMDRKILKVAIVTGGHEFDEPAFLALFKDLSGIAVTHLPQLDESELFEDISHWPYDVVVLYNMTQKISEKRQRNLLQLLEDGVGLLSMHHVSAAFQEWSEFSKIIGCRYLLSAVERDGKRDDPSTYQHDVDIPVHVAGTAHPVTAGVRDFVTHDETYKGCTFEPDNHILLTTTEPGSDRPLGWARSFRHSRVVHLQLGHGPYIFSEPQFRKIVEQAIRWCAEGRPEAVNEKGAAHEQ